MRAIELFCGIGGMTAGAEQAGLKVIAAVDVWERALEVHAANHAETTHLLADLGESFDYRRLPSHEVGLCGAPCTGFSPSRGRERPQDEDLRRLIWAVPRCAAVHHERLWLIENVPEVAEWDGWPDWRAAMEDLGYSIRLYVLDAAKFGVPQNRVRLYIACTLGGAECDPPMDLSTWHRPEMPAGTFVDWAWPRWNPVDRPGRAARTLQRVRRGRERLGTDRFFIVYYSSGSGMEGRSLDRPIGTLPAFDTWAVVDGERMRMLQPGEMVALMGLPANTRLSGTRREQMRLLGNAACTPVIRALLQCWFQTRSRGR